MSSDFPKYNVMQTPLAGKMVPSRRQFFYQLYILIFIWTTKYIIVECVPSLETIKFTMNDEERSDKL